MRVDAKRCSKCGEHKPLTEFYAAKHGRDGRRSDCKACNASRNREYRLRRESPPANPSLKVRRDWLWAEKSNPCERCGRRFHPVAMQFDHLPGFEKVIEVVARGGSLARLKAERAKCQLVCANCHSIITWERRTGEKVPTDG